MPKQRKSTMQFVRLPFKAREVITLWESSYFTNTFCLLRMGIV